MKRLLLRFLGLAPEHDWDATHVSTACLRHITGHLDTRGVDLPTWRTPKEVAQIRRLERRAALRLAKGA